MPKGLPKITFDSTPISICPFTVQDMTIGDTVNKQAWSGIVAVTGVG